jgi:hypothetical protein
MHDDHSDRPADVGFHAGNDVASVSRPAPSAGLDRVDTSRPDRWNRERLKALAFIVVTLAVLSKWLGLW